QQARLRRLGQSPVQRRDIPIERRVSPVRCRVVVVHHGTPCWNWYLPCCPSGIRSGLGGLLRIPNGSRASWVCPPNSLRACSSVLTAVCRTPQSQADLISLRCNARGSP